MAAKWIIYKDQFKLGNVGLHEELLGTNFKDPERRKEVKGGGLFKMDKEAKTFTLFGKSYDFGACYYTDFDEVTQWPTRFEDWTFNFTDEMGQVHKVK